MSATWLALVETVLMPAGALAAMRFTRWVAGLTQPEGAGTSAGPSQVHRRVVLMAAVAAWVILFGMVPFTVFALFVRGAAGAAGPPPAWEAVVLNLVPLALVASPFAGFVQGMRVSRPPVRPGRPHPGRGPS